MAEESDSMTGSRLSRDFAKRAKEHKAQLARGRKRRRHRSRRSLKDKFGRWTTLPRPRPSQQQGVAVVMPDTPNLGGDRQTGSAAVGRMVEGINTLVAQLQRELLVEQQRAAAQQEAAAKEMAELRHKLQVERQRTEAQAQAVAAAVKESSQWRKKLQEAEAFIRGRGLQKVQVE